MQCEAAKKGTGPQSYEVCLKCPSSQQSILAAGLRRYSRNRIIDHGLLNFAIVTGFGDLLYFVVTDGKTKPERTAGLAAWVVHSNAPRHA